MVDSLFQEVEPLEETVHHRVHPLGIDGNHRGLVLRVYVIFAVQCLTHLLLNRSGTVSRADSHRQEFDFISPVEGRLEQIDGNHDTPVRTTVDAHVCRADIQADAPV